MKATRIYPFTSARAVATTIALLLSMQLPAHAAAKETGAPPPSGDDIPPPVKDDIPAPSLQLAPPPAVITLKAPTIKGLISVDDQMDPFNLDASQREELSLENALRDAVNHNLDIGIAHTEEMQRKWHYTSSLGGFLPDLTGGYSLYGLAGKLALPFATGPGGGSSTVSLPGHFNLLTAGFTYNAYQGGRILFGARQNKHLLQAQRAQTHSTLSDTLLSVTKGYYNLLLAEALLEVRIRAVDTSVEQLRINTDLANNGLATNLDVLQSRTQLSRDRQELVTQQISRRAAAIELARILNADETIDITPIDRTLQKVRLVAQSLRIQNLLLTAIQNRPELKQSEELRLAAKNAIVVAAAPLQPTVKLGGNVYGLGENSLGTFYTLALSTNWTIKGLGVTDSSETQAARWQARQRMLASNQVLQQVISQVRNSLLQSLQAEQEIEETGNEVVSAKEELRLAKLRFENGLGNNIDVINAQRDLTSALVNRAHAMIDFNIAQAQLLHDIGTISVGNLTSVTPAAKG